MNGYISVRRRGAERVSFDNDMFGDFSEAWYHVRDVPFGDVFFVEDFSILWNRGSPGLQEEGNPNRAKDSSALRL